MSNIIVVRKGAVIRLAKTPIELVAFEHDGYSRVEVDLAKTKDPKPGA